MSFSTDLEFIRSQLRIFRSITVDHDLVRAVLVFEDKRFLRHVGVDGIAMFRAMAKNLVGRRGGGASTIDMQLVRTLTGRREFTSRRKIREIFLSVLIRHEFGAMLILDCYLQVAFFGTGLIGIDAAARELFGKATRDCEMHEKAALAALLLLPAPRDRNSTWQRRLSHRTAHCLDRL